MKVTLTQAQKPHDTNQLHDAFIAAGIPPTFAGSNNGDGSVFEFAEGVTAAAVQAVITNYTLAAKPPPPNILTLGQAYRTALQSATTFNQLKAVMLNEQTALLKAIARGHRGDMGNGG